ncbi:hypothetical protein BT63DRAFT_481864 [Microthyrium microscopicum]|uniref:Ino eighty subunit 1 n=1 Tax=Microthyrium microscopicum TaxID=703497 RepID=A0A6A6U167_9PEZI|nr:hypothetical protein BT63DRAFT_481864 [Microthyrium microscopicum]
MVASPPAVDDRGSLKHVLDDEPTAPSDAQAEQAEQGDEDGSDATIPASNIKSEDGQDSQSKPKSAKSASNDETAPQYTATTTTTRRNANGSVSSVYSGNKIRHLKKEDGVPLWRKDIQFDFLKEVFEDKQEVFHKASDGSFNNTFADIYLDAMAKSSKCSKILKDKLLSDRPAGVNMAMVCLLVNVGRMNTTLNFFPEMRAQLRTYHSIPSLQAHQDANAYKQLQDAPRLKSILKGATEDVEQPGTIEDIKAASIPRTNPVNLIFVLAQQAPKISETHFDVPRDFFDLVMKEQLSSKSRAKAFLWLMWWYLESDFSLKDAENNPYGPGRRSRDASDEDLPLKCPQFEFLTDEDALKENVDTEDELEFGKRKQQERSAIINGEVTPLFSGPKRFNVQKSKMYPQNPVFHVNTNNHGNDDTGSPTQENASPGASVSRSHRGNKPLRAKQAAADCGSDSDQTRSASPSIQPSGSKIRLNALLNESATSTPVPAPKGPGRGNWRRNRVDANGDPLRSSAIKGTPVTNGVDQPPATFFVPMSGEPPSLSGNGKRSRPPTSHQLALENFRKQRVTHILDRGLRADRIRASRRLARSPGSAAARAWKRLRKLPDGWDSDEEAHMTGAGRAGAAGLGVSLAGFKQLAYEMPDYGAEHAQIARAFARVRRRLDRQENGGGASELGEVKRRQMRRRAREELEMQQGDEMDVDEEEADGDIEGEGEGEGGVGIMNTAMDEDEFSEED